MSVPRIRTIKPDAFTSETLSSVDYFTRWTFAGLWTYFDDEGYGRGDARLIRAALFPLDDSVTPKKVEAALDRLIDIGAVCRYEVDGKPYLHAPNWGEHQKVNRATRTKLPKCPEHDAAPDGEVVGSVHGGLSEDSVRTHGGKGTGKGREKEPSSAAADGAFSEFWQHYPRKVAKAEAQRAYAKATKKADPHTILVGLKAHLPGWDRADPKFTPHASTWLNGERWNDQPDPPQQSQYAAFRDLDQPPAASND